MSRLLFAAARGARIYSKLNDGPWIKAYAVVKPGAVAGLQQRIHPDDEHLQYGPISTALRDGDGDYQWIAVRVDEMPTLAIETAIVTGYAGTLEQQWRPEKDSLTRSLFLLILAECLADEGL